jgi:hypothetical protein
MDESVAARAKRPTARFGPEKGGKPMTLELTAAEREFLLEILKDRLGSLKEQVHHSRTSTFTDQLKEKEVVLVGMIAKAEAAGSSV